MVMPAYNAAQTLKKTYNEIPTDLVNKIILVDDCSKDNTVEIARKLPINVVVHEQNKGYGGNLKTCYTAALKAKADIIVTLHPDYQYDPTKMPELIKPLLENKADIVYGSRLMVKGEAKKGHMPLYKRIGNKILTSILNWGLGVVLTDSATGYIAYKRKVLATIPFTQNSDKYTIDEEILIQCMHFGFKIVEVPIPTRYEKVSSSMRFFASIKYELRIFYVLLKEKLHKYHLIKSRQFTA